MRLTWVSFAIIALLAPAARPADDADTNAPESFFGPAKLHTFHLKVTRHAWTLMQPERRPRPAPLIAAEMPPPDAKKKVAPPGPPKSQPKEPKAPASEGETLPPNNFGWPFVYVKARLEFNGQVLDDVALRFKGNASFDNSGNYKKPYKLDFNRFAPGRK